MHNRKCLMSRPLLIGVGGAHSGAGKTTFAVALLTHLSGKNVSPSGCRPPASGALKKWGAIKYTKTDLYTSLIDNRAVLDRKDKDTGKLISAGAEEVLWIQGPRDEIEETVSIAIDRLSHLDGIVIEGNSAIEFSNPDIVIFIVGLSGSIEKPSANRLIKRADIIVFTKDSGHYPKKSGIFPGPRPHASDDVSAACAVYFDPEDETTKRELLEHMDEIIEKRLFDRIKQLLKERAVDGRLTCPAARQIAEELQVSYSEVGKAANELKVKIKDCELGCF